MGTHSPPVIYYHSVAPRKFEGWPLDFLTMPLVRFEHQLQYFQARSYRAIFLDEWFAIRNGQRPGLGNEFCLTFDDGLLDNWVHAFPLVKKYGMKFTLFVCPELIEPSDAVRYNLEDVWTGKCNEGDLIGLGQLSWGELRVMQASGHVDVQSHTMSHAKYIVSDRLRGFYYGGFSGFYPILNSYGSDEKPFYARDAHFGERMPMGAPLFEERSSVTARIVRIDPEFHDRAAALAGQYDLMDTKARSAYEQQVLELHLRYRDEGKLVISTGSFTDDIDRLEYEINVSKRMIETKLDKAVRFLCWPHGDNSLGAHAMALEAGYSATTAGKLVDRGNDPDRIPRFGTDWDIHPWLVDQKLTYKLASHRGTQPYHAVWWANEWKNRLLGRS